MRLIFSAISCFSFVGLSQATVLTFEGMNLGNYGAILSNYGDRVTSPGASPTGTYLEGNGWTGNVAVSHNTVTATGEEFANSISYWSTYGDLNDVAFASSNGYYLRIKFTPDEGYAVNLHSFDIASYLNAVRTAQRLRVMDLSGNILWSSEPTTLPSGPTHLSFSPEISSTTGLILEMGNDWNIGIDNVSFSQTAVPEPATLALMGVGLSGLLLKRKKK